MSGRREKPPEPEASQLGCPSDAPTGSLVDERTVVEIGGGELVLLGPVVLGVLPFGLVAALRQQMHAAHQIAGIEVLRIDPGQQGHVVILRPQGWCDLPRAFFLYA